MSQSPPKGQYIRQAWLVILLALLYGGALAGVQTTLGPRIAQNKLNETLSQVPVLVPGAVQDQTEPLELTGAVDGKSIRVYRAVGDDGTTIGWVLPAAGQGFADRIELLIGVDASAETITGLFVLDQKETPGLGDYITGAPFRDQFAGKPTDSPLTIAGNPTQPQEILPLTGATISSESVAAIINAAIDNLKQPIQAYPAERPGGTGGFSADVSGCGGAACGGAVCGLLRCGVSGRTQTVLPKLRSSLAPTGGQAGSATRKPHPACRRRDPTTIATRGACCPVNDEFLA